MKLLVLDNYDSFTYNLVHLIEKVSDLQFKVVANDHISIKDVAEYDKILLSPGPGLPSQAGIMPELIHHYYSSRSILGVCLGMQAIAEAFGGTLLNLDTVFHGISTPIHIIKDDPLFSGCPKEFNAGRYHSWVVDPKTLPADLEITATDNNELIMALRHKRFDVCGVQFHPESILSQYGENIIRNWLTLREQ